MKAPKKELMSFSVKGWTREARQPAPLLAFADFLISVKSRNGARISAEAGLPERQTSRRWADLPCTKQQVFERQSWASPHGKTSLASLSRVRELTGESSFNGNSPAFSGKRHEMKKVSLHDS
ncbi:hypothetical protein [Achromobacter xylosoxidans]|uniref:hypothetical protein n=1 Tax=Alcaligenes xylosoxydans xylosoxydans TaxID=85698 RepID=UPI001EED9BAF|nr:hypothetical protein [Achromobacter xylosoxidans]